MCVLQCRDLYRDLDGDLYWDLDGDREGQREGRAGADDAAGVDVLARGAVHLRVRRLDGGSQSLHAVDALCGVTEGGVQCSVTMAMTWPVHVGVLRRLGAALSRDADEGLGGGARRHRWRRLFIGGDTR